MRQDQHRAASTIIRLELVKFTERPSGPQRRYATRTGPVRRSSDSAAKIPCLSQPQCPSASASASSGATHSRCRRHRPGARTTPAARASSPATNPGPSRWRLRNRQGRDQLHTHTHADPHGASACPRRCPDAGVGRSLDCRACVRAAFSRSLNEPPSGSRHLGPLHAMRRPVGAGLLPAGVQQCQGDCTLRVPASGGLIPPRRPRPVPPRAPRSTDSSRDTPRSCIVTPYSRSIRAMVTPMMRDHQEPRPRLHHHVRQQRAEPAPHWRRPAGRPPRPGRIAAPGCSGTPRRSG